jgi:hypothetical protein
MSTRSITETPAARNRRLLIAALAAGQVARRLWGDRFQVTSRSGGPDHIVTRTVEADYRVRFHCDCQWAARAGDVVLTQPAPGREIPNATPPCSHVLTLRLALMDGLNRAALLARDPDLSGAWERNREASRAEPLAA